MPNSNYRAGRALEYEVMRDWTAKGYTASRTAGSHGPYDVIAFRPDRMPELIQCKRVSNATTSKRLVESFKTITAPSRFYHQVMTIKIKGTKVLLSYTV